MLDSIRHGAVRLLLVSEKPSLSSQGHGASDNLASMPHQLNYTIDAEDGIFIARCLELDITTDGLSKEDALANLQEALDCYFANPDAQLEHLGSHGSDMNSF